MGSFPRLCPEVELSWSRPFLSFQALWESHRNWYGVVDRFIRLFLVLGFSWVPCLSLLWSLSFVSSRCRSIYLLLLLSLTELARNISGAGTPPSKITITMAPMARPKPIFCNSSASSRLSAEDDNIAYVFVGRGDKMKKFRVNKRMLSNVAPFFEDQLDATPAGIVKVSSDQKPVPVWMAQQNSIIRLPNESASMFDLFVVWLHQRESFRRHLDEMINLVSDAPGVPCQRLHWALVRLHVFAARLELHHLQDLAIDALQDIYLRCNWDVTPQLVEYVYDYCDAVESMRLRRWTVAMVAWSIAGGASSLEYNDDGGLDRIQDMFEIFPEFANDYTSHLRKMKSSKLDTRIKNPQLRIPANKLRNEERQFGFRQCSFHSHRAAVGERRCPHVTASMELDNFLLVPLVMEIAPLPTSTPSRRDVPEPLRLVNRMAQAC